MKCPFCLIEYHDDAKKLGGYRDANGNWEIVIRTCSACNCSNLKLENVSYITRAINSGLTDRVVSESILIYPHRAVRPPCPNEVPEKYSNDYNEACLTLLDSPKASAALSRRCLQLLLRDEVGVSPQNLSHEIQEVLDTKILPKHLAESIDAIRNIGNFAAHPLKSDRSGEIVDVEPGEAEWSLDVLEGLFEHFFVQPTMLTVKRTALNKKLSELGKPPMK